MKRPKKRIEIDPNKHEVISVYVPTELKQRAEIVARRQGRKLSQLVRWALELEVNAAEDAPRRPALRHQGLPSLKLKSGLFED